MKKLIGIVLTVVALHSASLGVAQSIAVEELSLEKKVKLAKAGDIEAVLALGTAFEVGQGIAPNLFQAAKWYREAASKGNIEAQFRLGRILRAGAPKLPADVQSALKLFEDAAQKGHGEAAHTLALSYQNGQDVQKDIEKAKAFFEKGALANFAASQTA